MVNILHLSDLHFSKKSNFSQKIVLDAALNRLEKLSNSNLAPDLVVFSGDLVWAADEEDIFYHLYDDVISPVLKKTRCDESKVVICPGNHDAHSSELERDHLRHNGLLSECDDREKLNNLASNGNLSDILDNRFSGYSDFRNSFAQADQKFSDGLSELISFPEYKLDFITINTAWLTGCGIKSLGSDKNKLFVPEVSLYEPIQQLNSNSRAILVSHHPFNWLQSDNEEDAYNTLSDKIDIHLFGHMHEPKPSSIVDPKGVMLNIQAGGLYTGRERYNGFSLISIEPEQNYSAIRLYSYYETRREFDVATDKAKNGTFFNSSESEKYWYKQDRKIDRNTVKRWLKNNFIPKADAHFEQILADRLLGDVFVEPPLTKHSSGQTGPVSQFLDEVGEEHPSSVQEIITSASNFIIYGKQEFGRTTLLQKIAFEISKISIADDNEPQVPILIPFDDIKAGASSVERLLRSNICCDPEEFSINQLLDGGKVLILIDDVNFSNDAKMKVLKDFLTKYKNNKFIFSTLLSHSDTAHLLGNDLIIDAEIGASFEHVRLHQFDRGKMRNLVKKWHGFNDEKSEGVLKRLTQEFRQMNIPATALNGTILLTLYENVTGFGAPLNRAVLVERFIEYLLEKNSVNEAFRGTFDFRNKTHALSNLAAYMCEENQYTISKDNALTFFATYLETLGLPETPENLYQIFVASRVLEERHGNYVRFRYRFFLEYFIATQMCDDEMFKSKIMLEGNYLSYINEIEYYAAKTRNDLALLETISFRFSNLSKEIQTNEGWGFNLSSFDAFSLPSTDEKISTYDHLEAQTQEPPLTAEERDEILNAEIPTDNDARQEVYRPRMDDPESKWLGCLLLYSGILKSLEMISDSDKRKHISLVLHSWGVITLQSFASVPVIAEKRKIRINGVLYNINLPKTMSDAEVARFLYTELPNSFANMIFERLGTAKFQKQLDEPLLEEHTEPTIVKYFRTYIYSELKMPNWIKALSTLSESIPNSHCLKESLVRQLADLYLMGNLNNDNLKGIKSLTTNIVGELRGTDQKSIQQEKQRISMKLEKKALLKKIRLSARENDEKNQ